MAKYGVKIAQPGADVNAPDQQMLFHSEFPSLRIAKILNVTLYESQEIIIPHNLGFPPWYSVWKRNPNFDGQVSWPRQWHSDYGGAVLVDKTNVWMSVDNFFGATFPQHFQFILYTFPINVNFNAPVVGAGVKPPQAAQYEYGIAAMRPGKDARFTQEVSDMHMSTLSRSPLIHSNTFKYGTIGGAPMSALDYGITVPHNLGYKPLCLTAISRDGGNIWYVDNYFYSNDTNSYMISGTNDLMALLILKDPYAPADIAPQVVNYNG